MPPNDDPNATPANEPANDPTPAADPTNKDGGGGGAPTIEDFQAALGSAMDQATGPLAEQLKTLSGRLDGIETTLKPATPGQGADGDVVEDLAARLLTDPDATLKAYLGDWAKETMGPALSRNFENQRDDRIAQRAAQFDERYGQGSFDTFIRPTILGDKGTLSTYATNHQADPSVIDATIAGAVGLLELDTGDEGKKWGEAKVAASKARETRERNVATPPNLLGPGGRAAPNTRLAPEVEAGVDKLNEAGFAVSKASLQKASELGGSLDDWAPHLAKQRAAEAAGGS